MEAVNVQPLQARRPYEGEDEQLVQIPPAEESEGDYENGAEAGAGAGGDQSRRSSQFTMSRCTNSARTSELTISFEGEVYVFPAVTPDKVRCLLYSFFCKCMSSFGSVPAEKNQITCNESQLETLVKTMYVYSLCSNANSVSWDGWRLLMVMDDSYWCRLFMDFVYSELHVKC